MRGRFRSSDPGFSIVEIVIGMAIMATLLGVTINTYQDSVSRARREVALSDAKAIANSVQRWQLDNNRPYPFDSVLPLVPQYIRNVKNDPWSGSFQIDSVRKVVYSFGPNGVDDQGQGDDIPYFFDTRADVPPGPPENVTVRLDGADVRVSWRPPSRNSDGSLAVAGDVADYTVFIRSAQEIEPATWTANEPGAPQGDGSLFFLRPRIDIANIIYPTVPNALDQSYYFTVRARDPAGNFSPPSNQAGLFVAKTVDPRIVVFQPSSTTPGVSSAFSFFIEVADADANLARVRLNGWPGNPTWTTAPGVPGFIIDNPFRFALNWAPPPADLAAVANRLVYLEATDSASPSATTTSASILIQIRNTRPVITAVNPGITLLTVNPANPVKVRIPFTCEATDEEGNMNEMTVKLVERTTAATNVVETQVFSLNPPGGVMVRQVEFNSSLYFSLLQRKEYEVEVTAKDTLNDTSLVRKAKLLIKEDTTPPDALSLSLDPSNVLLTTAPGGPWYIRTQSAISFDCDAFEVESPPVRFQVRIAEAPLLGQGGTPTTHFDIGAAMNASNTTTWPGWFTTNTAQITLLTGSGLIGTFVENKPYYAGMRALNAANLLNISTATPLHVASFNSQNPFKLDKTPPQVQEVKISGEESLGTTWITNLLDAEWTVTDWVGGTPPYLGSGPNKYRFRVRVKPAIEPVPLTYRDWTEVDTLELRSFPLPNNTTANGQLVYLDIQARDRAGNWTPGFATSIARSDFTSPEAMAGPRITNQVGNVISVIDTFSAAWDFPPAVYPIPGPGVLKDFESGILSYEWGISTTSIFVGFPDVFGFQPVQGFVTSGTVSQNNLLVSGDRVHAVLRARNFAGSVSPHVSSTPSLVDASLFTSLVGFPGSGLSPLSVQFTAVVSGGQPPYTYTFQFDGTGNPSRTYSVVTSSTNRTTSFVYDFGLPALADLPRPEIISRLIIRDVVGRESRKDFIVEVYDDLMAAVAMKNHPGIQFFRFTGSSEVPVYSVRVPGPSGFLAMGVDPRGQYLAAVARDRDEVYRVGLDNVQAGLAGLMTTALISGFAGTDIPDSATFTFARNLSKGLLVETFAGKSIPGAGCSTGSIRVVPIGVGFPGSPNQFPCIDGAVRDFRIGAASSTQLRVGAVVQFEGSQTVVRHMSNLDTGFPVIDSFVLPAVLPSSARLGVGDDAIGQSFAPPPPLLGSNGPGFGARAVARPGTNEIYFSSNEAAVGDADRGLHFVNLGSGGLAGVGKIPFSGAAERIGPFDFNENGSMVVIASSGPPFDGSGWRLSAARMPMTSIPAFGAAQANRIANLDLDDGGSYLAVSDDTGSARLAQINLLPNPPVIEPAASWQSLNVAVAPFGGATVAETRIFRRPNKGYPKPIGLYHVNDCDLNGTPLPQAGAQAIVAGINMDRPSITVRVNRQGAGPVEIALPAGGNVPPFVPPDVVNCPTSSFHRPASGDAFHFKRVTLPALTSGVAGPNVCELRLDVLVGSGNISTLTTAIINK